jgi:YHS domain-containing protein
MGRKTMLDPICDMIVDIEDAREHGLVLERPEREYAFCSAGCLQRFAKDPKAYVPKVEAWLGGSAATEAAHHAPAGAMQIDAGIRAWYASCRCCLSESHPELVEILDAEKAKPA